MFNIILSTSFKKYETVTDNSAVRIYVNKIENRITFKIKSGYYIQVSMPETMKLLGSIKTKVTKDKSGKNYWIIIILLERCRHNSNVFYTFFPNKLYDQLIDISPKIVIFLKKL